MERGELLGPQHPERLENLGADLVLPAVAAGRCRERGPIPLSAVQLHEQPVVLVVWMRGGHHEDAGVAKVPQRQAERDVPLFLVDGDDAHLRARSQDRMAERRAAAYA